MTYDALKSSMGKQFVVFVELYIDTCSQVYGVAPCTASVPTTGSQKCFNTLRTCQDTANYTQNAGGKTYRFATTEIDALQLAGDAVTFPTLRSIDTAPTRLTPGKGLGIRSSVVLKLEDHPWTDVSVDPYVRTRTYTPDNQGSFWGKFLARNPNYEGRVINIFTGYLEEDGTYDPLNFRRRSYLINKISGPDTDGRVSIEAKDPLKKTDIDKAQWPVASRASLSSVALIGDTILEVADPDSAITSAFAQGQEYLRLGDEVVQVLSIVDNTGGFYSITVSRSASPAIYDNSLNVQAEHNVNASVQPCWFFDEERIDYVLRTLLESGASMDLSYLPTGLWAAEILSTGLDNYLLSALITAPTGVQTLLNELCEHGIYVWWDERQQFVLLKSVISQMFDGTPLDEDTDIIAGSLSVTRDVKNRVSQTWIYYGLRFPTIDMKLLASYSSLQVKIDTAAESPEEYDQIRIQSIYSRWLPTAKASTASEIATRLLRAYRDSKILLALSLDPKDDDEWTGDLVGVLTSLVQDESGAPLEKNYTILEVDESISDNGVQYKYTLQSESTLRRVGVITPTYDIALLQHDGVNVEHNLIQVVFTTLSEPIQWDAMVDIEWAGGEQIIWSDGMPVPFPDYTPASQAYKDHYAFICYDTGLFLDGTPAYQIR